MTTRHRPGCYGLTLDTDLTFENRLAPGDGSEVVRITSSPGPVRGRVLRDGQVLAASAAVDGAGAPLASLHRSGGSLILRVRRVADYELLPDGVHVHVTDPSRAALVELHLLGPVLGLWLERRGVVVLHAAAVLPTAGGAVAFLAHQGAGKSTLAAAFLRSGARLLSDDLLAMEVVGDAVRCRPGFPTMRMWPEQARAVVGDDRFPVVHPGTEKRRVPVGAGGFGSFCGRTQTLSTLYLPCRHSDPSAPVRMESVSGREATVELMRHSFVGALAVAALGTPRVRVVAEVARRVAVERLVYPSGPEGLEEAVARVRSAAAPVGAA